MNLGVRSGKRLLLYGIIFVAGGLIGAFMFGRFAEPDIAYGVREDSSNYKFIHPLLFIKTPEEQAFPQYAPLKKAIEEHLAQKKGEGKVDVASVYFRNLESSQWVAINPEYEFSPASLLKVITLITFLRHSEKNPELLSSRVKVEQADESLNEMYFAPTKPARSGETHTIEALLEKTITESDNVANFILLKIIGDESVKKTHADLEFRVLDPSSNNTYTPLEYSRIFRTLYNGTYLSRTNSERALQLLSRTTFTQGIVAGVPEGTTVSHKFGTRALFSAETSAEIPGATKELHDCGIVYYPGSPYFLCVMTRGDDFKDLESTIQDISRLTWEQVARLTPSR